MESDALSVEDSVASGASARVGAILAKAEARARTIKEEAERQARGFEESARAEAERIEQDAHRAAYAAARERVQEISRLRSSIAARAGSMVDGLEGAELTRARLEDLVAALGEAADSLLEEVGEPGSAADVPRRASETAAPSVTAAASVEASAPTERPVAYDGDIPDGAPMKRRPRRAREARFAAVLMAIQGLERDRVEEQLHRDYGVADCDQLLDDVFGRADAPA